MTPSAALAGVAQVGLWRCGLDWLPGLGALAWLSDEERARARRFAAESDRRRYLAAHCALRELLSLRTGLPAQNLQIVAGAFGKPRLLNADGCCFNLSHSGEVALLGIGRGSEIGVDVELRHEVANALALARGIASAAEFAAFVALDDALHSEAFLRLWTRKEACLKAVGTGLSIEPSSLDVGLGDAPVRLAIGLPAGPVPVEVCAIDAGPDVLAALARVL